MAQAGYFQIDDVSQLPIDLAEQYRKQYGKGLKVRIPYTYGYTNVETQESYTNYDEYSIDEYRQILSKLHEIVDDIDMSLPEEQRFAIVYERVSKNIEYDHVAGYPKHGSRREQKYAKNNSRACRNLSNGLLKGKAVCAGYAEILRNALKMVGIESQLTTLVIYKTEEQLLQEGYQKNVVNGVVSYQRPNAPASEHPYTPLPGKEGAFNDGSSHATNVVKINGIWYNVDPTWDHDNFVSGQLPIHALVSERDGTYADRVGIGGKLECPTSYPLDKLSQLFHTRNISLQKLQKLAKGSDLERLLQIKEFDSSQHPEIYDELIPKKLNELAKSGKLEDEVSKILSTSSMGNRSKMDLQSYIDGRNELAKSLKNMGIQVNPEDVPFTKNNRGIHKYDVLDGHELTQYEKDMDNIALFLGISITTPREKKTEIVNKSLAKMRPINANIVARDDIFTALVAEGIYMPKESISLRTDISGRKNFDKYDGHRLTQKERNTQYLLEYYNIDNYDIYDGHKLTPEERNVKLQAVLTEERSKYGDAVLDQMFEKYNIHKFDSQDGHKYTVDERSAKLLKLFAEEKENTGNSKTSGSTPLNLKMVMLQKIAEGQIDLHDMSKAVTQLEKAILVEKEAPVVLNSTQKKVDYTLAKNNRDTDEHEF